MFYGCSALSLALGVADDGKVAGFEITAKYIENGKPFFAEAGVSDKIIHPTSYLHFQGQTDIHT